MQVGRTETMNSSNAAVAWFAAVLRDCAIVVAVVVYCVDTL